MTTRLRFLGVAGYEIVGPEYRLLIDPFLTGNGLAPVGPDEIEAPDLVLVTHAALDHLGDTAAIAKRTGSPVVCGGDVRLKLIDEGLAGEQVQATVWGILTEVAGISVRPVECHHWSMATLRDGRVVSGTPLAFIVEPEPDVRIYHYGDTSIFDMSLIGKLYEPTVGLLGCTVPKELAGLNPGPGVLATGEMDAREAALTAEMLGLRLAVACHYLEPDEEVGQFLRLVKELDSTGSRQAVAPAVGQTLLLDSHGYEIEGSF